MGMLDRIQGLLKGKKVDISKRFELLKEAVSGTMSNFYMARDRENDKVVGLKVGIREKVEFFESRFKGLNKPAEGEIAMKIKHPLIVETREYGMTTEGVPYIIMEYVPGMGMHTLIGASEAILRGKRLKLIRQMAEAIHAVHTAGFIHRDVCPRNFICHPNAESVKLIDFGLTLPATPPFMQPGNRTGTPLYMAPEVVRRRATDQRLDIFSFGVTAYHLLAFELPWPVSETSGMAAMAHDSEPTDIFHWCPQLNKKLGTAIMKCMAPNRDNRPESFEAFLRDIRQVESEEA